MLIFGLLLTGVLMMLTKNYLYILFNAFNSSSDKLYFLAILYKVSPLFTVYKSVVIVSVSSLGMYRVCPIDNVLSVKLLTNLS